MKKIVITEEVGKAIDQLWQWARCEASTAVALPVWQTILKAVVDDEEKVKNEEESSS